MLAIRSGCLVYLSSCQMCSKIVFRVIKLQKLTARGLDSTLAILSLNEKPATAWLRRYRQKKSHIAAYPGTKSLDWLLYQTIVNTVMSKAYLILLLAILPCLALAWSPRCPAKVQARDGSTYSLKNIEGMYVN